ncbi:chemotaxis protein CheX [Sporomusa aerivorans]|uniref:chemotaxis protein CheX n=1 Tax=Sporomusa aerivorans TaxID=204936 RepID=UPI00352ACC4C
MDARFVNPFIVALTTVLPQLGFKSIVRGKLYAKEQFIDSQGVLVNVQLTNQVSGNVAFTMSQDSAKRISSVMMMGMAVESFDDVAQSALCEMINMVTSNAVNSLNKEGLAVGLVPPALSQDSAPLKICNSSFIGIEMIIDELPLQIGIGLN